MTPYFSTPERLGALESAAAAWLGTPYVQTGAVRGSGASCHMLAAAVLRDAGCPLPEVPQRGITGLRGYTTAMRAWLDGHPEHFAPIALADVSAGDVLLCEIGCGHIALVLGEPGARVLQVLRHTPAHLVSLADAGVRSHVLAAFRPAEITP